MRGILNLGGIVDVTPFIRSKVSSGISLIGCLSVGNMRYMNLIFYDIK